MAYVLVVVRTKAIFVVCNLNFGKEITTYIFLLQKLFFCCVCGPLLVEFDLALHFVSISFLPRLKSHAGNTRILDFEMVKFFEAESFYKLFSCDCVNGCNRKMGNSCPKILYLVSTTNGIF